MARWKRGCLEPASPPVANIPRKSQSMTHFTLKRALFVPGFLTLLSGGLVLAPRQTSLQGTQQATQPVSPGSQKGPQKSTSRPARKAEPLSDSQEDPFQKDPRKILAPFDDQGVLGRMKMAWHVSQLTEDQLANTLLPYLTGERKQLTILVQQLIAGLADVRYARREQAERELINLGPRIGPILELFQKEMLELEVTIRLDRAARTIKRQGDDDIQRRARRARGLAEVLEYRRGKLETRALLEALDNLDLRVRLAAIRSLGVQLEDEALAKEYAESFAQRIRKDISLPDLERRNAVVAAIAGSPLASSTAYLEGILANAGNATSLRLLSLRLLWQRMAARSLEALEKSIAGPDEKLLKAALAFYAKRPKNPAPATDGLSREGPSREGQASEGTEAPALRIKLKDGGEIVTTVLGLRGDKLRVVPSEDFGRLSELRIPRAMIDQILIEGKGKTKGKGKLNLLMKTGTRLAVSEVRFDGKYLVAEVFGRTVRLEKKALRCILPSHVQPRAFGGSRNFDQVRLSKKNQKPQEGLVKKLTQDGFSFRLKGDPVNKTTKFDWTEVETLLFKLGKATAPLANIGDLNQYVQVDLRDGQRLVGFLLDMNSTELCVVSHAVGCVSLPLQSLSSIQLSNSGRALTGFTLIVDYGNTRVFEVDGEGREVWALEDLFDPVDAELTPEGNILVTEQADNAVREYDRSHEIVWEFTDLNHPKDADRLANGNTLITDTSSRRVIEVTPDKKIVWEFNRKHAGAAIFKPYDADRLADGNTLICDYDGERVIEVNPAGKIVWQQKGCKWVYDADRLPNGNTLITLHKIPGKRTGMVFEVDVNHSRIWSVVTQSSPSDADRLPDGTTLVAEDGGVRVYSKQGKVLRKMEADWAWEANGY